jgi:hypothetical protein
VRIGSDVLASIFIGYLQCKVSTGPLDIVTGHNSSDGAWILLWSGSILILLHHDNHILIGLFPLHEECIVTTPTGKDEKEERNEQPQETTTQCNCRKGGFTNVAIALNALISVTAICNVTVIVAAAAVVVIVGKGVLAK